MDITYTSNNNKFNYRVGAIIINDNKLLVIHDERSTYYYLPGARVKMKETAEKTIIREVEEELMFNDGIITKSQYRDFIKNIIRYTKSRRVLQ